MCFSRLLARTEWLCWPLSRVVLCGVIAGLVGLLSSNVSVDDDHGTPALEQTRLR